jgi:hypothetical protein
MKAKKEIVKLIHKVEALISPYVLFMFDVSKFSDRYNGLACHYILPLHISRLDMLSEAVLTSY